MDKTASLPVGADMGVWAANEVQKHEEVCGLRYEAIAREQKRLADLLEQSQRDAAAALLKATADQGVRIKAIEDKISGIAPSLTSAGKNKVKLFDPTLSREWLANGGKAILERKIAERRGQGVLKLVPKSI